MRQFNTEEIPSMRELTAEEILQVSGGRADFSGVTSRVDSTAEITNPWLQRARAVLMYQAIFG